MKINRKTWKYKYITSVVLYLKETWKNKLVALLMVAIGMLPVILENDGTFLLLISFFVIPLFLIPENVFNVD